MIYLDTSYGLGTEYMEVTFVTSDDGNVTVSNAVVFACYEPTRESEGWGPLFEIELRREKTCVRGFRSCPAQTRLYGHRIWLDLRL